MWLFLTIGVNLRRQTIKNSNTVAVLKQFVRQMRTDEACPTRNQHVLSHRSSMLHTAPVECRFSRRKNIPSLA
jgi:hypothetical protein